MQNKGEMHKGHRQRLKNRAMTTGINNLPSHEVLELLLTYTIPYKDVNPLAHSLIDHFGSFSNVLEAGYEQLVNFMGVGNETAMFLDFMPKFFAEYTKSKNSEKVILNNTNDCVNYFKTIISPSNVEEVYMLSLDGNKKLLRKEHFTSSSASSITIDSKMFANIILGSKTKYIIMMHTHPSGATLPSKADLLATSKMLDMCKMFGAILIDHIIMGDGEYYSFYENALFDRNNQEMLIKTNDNINIGKSRKIVSATE